MKKSVIAAISDMHGMIPEIKGDCILCICGDIFPQDIERKMHESKNWFYEVFLPWVKNLACEFVIMIPGNHCFYLESEFLKHGKIILPDNFKNKCVCLVDESFIYKGLCFYGTPWVTNLSRWAFNTTDPKSVFEKIPVNCDILLTHHAPNYEKLGCSYPYTDKERCLGSVDLANVILTRSNIKYHFCGHIHTGTHGGVRIGNTMSYNVSILDEQYKESFPVTYIELSTD